MYVTIFTWAKEQCSAFASEDILFTQTQKKPYGCTRLTFLRRDHDDDDDDEYLVDVDDAVTMTIYVC